MSPFRIKTCVRLLTALGLLAMVSGSALAEQSDQNWQLELKFGPYKPSVDDEFSGGTQPFDTIYGSTSVLLGVAEIDWQFWRGIGSLALGVSGGYSQDRGTALAQDGSKSNDKTTFNVVPLQVHLVYNFDYLATDYGIPFVPYAKGGFDYWIWWFDDASGDTSKANGRDALGGTLGWHVGGGLRFLLDWFDESSANSFDLEIGVNNSYIFGEFLYSQVDDFGSSKSISIGDAMFMGGLAFEF